MELEVGSCTKSPYNWTSYILAWTYESAWMVPDWLAQVSNWRNEMPRSRRSKLRWNLAKRKICVNIESFFGDLVFHYSSRLINSVLTFVCVCVCENASQLWVMHLPGSLFWVRHLLNVDWTHVSMIFQIFAFPPGNAIPVVAAFSHHMKAGGWGEVALVCGCPDYKASEIFN